MFYIPVRHEGFGEHVPEKARAGPEAGPAVWLGEYINVLDFQKVSRFGPLHIDWPGERMADLLVHRLHVGSDGVRVHLTVGGVTGLYYDVLVLAHLEYRRNIGMPAVVPGFGLFSESFGPVYLHELSHA